MEVQCEFKTISHEFSDTPYYICEVVGKSFILGEELIYNGSHENGKNYQNVTGIVFNNCEMLTVPQDLTKFFPNLTLLDINESYLKELNKNDLEEYKSFEIFIFTFTEIGSISSELFQGFESLHCVLFLCNKLRHIATEHLNVKHMNFLQNVSIQLSNSHNKQFPQFTIESIKARMVENKVETLKKKLEEVESQLRIHKMQTNLSEDKLNRDIWKLKVSELNLTKQIQSFKESELMLCMEVQNLIMNEEKLKTEVKNVEKDKETLKNQAQQFKLQFELEVKKSEVSAIFNDELNLEVERLNKLEWNSKLEISELKESLEKGEKQIKMLNETIKNYSVEINKLRQSEILLMEEIKNLEEFRNIFQIQEAQIKMQKLPSSMLDKIQELEVIKKNLCEKFESLEKSETFLRQQIESSKIFESKLSLDVEVLGNSEKYIKQQIKELQDSETKLTKDIETLKTSEAGLKQKLENVKLFEEFSVKEDIKPALHPQDGIYSDLKTYTEDDQFKDFTIIIDGEKFLVHKFLLAARCLTLAKIFKANPNADTLNLVGISTNAFEVILRFLYTDELPPDQEIRILQLYEAAGRLKIPKLQKIVSAKLAGQISSENAMDVFNISHKNDDEELRQKAFNEIRKCYPLVEFRDEWLAQPNRVAKCVKKFEEHIEKFKVLSEDSGDE